MSLKSRDKEELHINKDHVLGRGIFVDDKGQVTSIVPSNMSHDFYKTFELLPVPSKHSLPIVLENTFDYGLQKEVVHHYIFYQNDTDHDDIGKKLNDFDRKILSFIGRFRNVQFYHLMKEFYTQNTDKLKSSLVRLKEYLLIREWKFEREDKPGEFAKCYSINRNGTHHLKHHQLINPKDTYKWANIYDNLDRYEAIRFWKICDTYQALKITTDFHEFHSQCEYFPKFYEYEEVIFSKNELGKEVKKIKKHRQRLPKFKVDGEIEFFNQEHGLTYYFDLFPIIDAEESTDIEVLSSGLGHFGLLTEELRKEISNGDGPIEAKQKMLVAIVDNWNVAKKVIKMHNLESYNGSFLFLDLSQVKNEDLLTALFKYRNLNGGIWDNFPIQVKQMPKRLRR